VRQGDKVWAVGSDGILHVRKAQVVRAMRDEVLAYLDLEKNERIITSQLSGVTDGMVVRLTNAD